MEAFLQQVLNFLTIELTVLLTAALPIIELRGAIPVGMSLGLSPLHATFISFIGSMIPVPIILFTSRPIFNYLKKTRLFKKMVNKLTDRSLNNNGGRIQKYGAWGLLLIVAIPLPGTGVWSGSLAAALLDMRFKWAFPAILLGNLIAAIAIMTLSNGVVSVLSR
ncbi:COG2426 family protein [Clostridium formicaceticum]|uniref:Ligand-binding protein SH3 n=1 Tax=Clostridium formicaceticum TaxID=1497 RepID=A0AAC9WFK2_9CLOT|nr:small multi-drug export protein [Clostridium formicaceticum]AOY75611.1 ligand-binding protein SH3 [Clostridium formicaceticum]ARE85920.1 Putative small multi-drug export protein [Clostridium formicaceticum]